MRALILVLGLWLSANIQAMCAAEQVTILPLKDELSPNACFLFEGYGLARELTESLSFDTTVFLESETGDQVKLNAIDFNSGALAINQTLLQPEQALIPGSKYTLKFDNLDQLERIPYSLMPDQAPRSWTVGADKNEPTPSLLIAPEFINSEVQFFGCGPAVYAEFEFITDSDAPVLVKTELVDVTADETYTYFLRTSDKDTLKVGHGMCSGAFKYVPEHDYQVRFSIMDECNTLADDWTEWLEFDNPFKALD